MGHLGNMKHEYYELSKRLDKNVVGFPEPENETAHKGWLTILELLYTPEEAMIVLYQAIQTEFILTQIDALAVAFVHLHVLRKILH